MWFETLYVTLFLSIQARNLKSQPRTRCQAAATEEAPTEPAAAAEGLSQHLRIKLKSFDIGLLDLSVQEIMQVANSTGGYDMHAVPSCVAIGHAVDKKLQVQ